MNLSEFQLKISEANKPVVVDFWATWCLPCKKTKPILEKLGKEYADNVNFLPIDVSESSELLEQFKILGIPTVLAFQNGKEVGRVTGMQDESGYRAIFDALVEGKEIKGSIPPFDRLLRIGAGVLFGIVGFSTGNWLVLGLGGLIAFWGVHDRCPIWAAIKGRIRKK